MAVESQGHSPDLVAFDSDSESEDEEVITCVKGGDPTNPLLQEGGKHVGVRTQYTHDSRFLLDVKLFSHHEFQKGVGAKGNSKDVRCSEHLKGLHWHRKNT